MCCIYRSAPLNVWLLLFWKCNKWIPFYAHQKLVCIIDRMRTRNMNDKFKLTDVYGSKNDGRYNNSYSVVCACVCEWVELLKWLFGSSICSLSLPLSCVFFSLDLAILRYCLFFRRWRRNLINFELICQCQANASHTHTHTCALGNVCAFLFLFQPWKHKLSKHMSEIKHTRFASRYAFKWIVDVKWGEVKRTKPSRSDLRSGFCALEQND